ncbi:hypothetical protein H5410_064591 [Solanum commersonii]|uniref:Uncharacterized protein n=1 Tax=Solanum commersonii TaxID=4109 RepID=A0A9J5VYW9_SOLCO|nr:hypothetical protein H5410_064591 [Solanum commersonii]
MNILPLRNPGPIKEKVQWGAFWKVELIECLHSSNGTVEKRNIVIGWGKEKSRVDKAR